MADYKRFPGLADATAYPGTATVDPYKYRNDFDYSRWQADTKLTLANVPWCGDYENVVKFDDDAARDAYLAGVSGPSDTLETMRHVKPDDTIKLPWPVDVVQHYNYLIVDLPVPTSANDPIWGEQGRERKGRYLYFIDDAVQAAASTTLVSLHLDVWSTFIDDMTFTYIMLERGHAPAAAVSPDAYLTNPRVNARYLLAPDVDFGAARSVTRGTNVDSYDSLAQWFVVVTNANFEGEWGSLSAPLSPGTPYNQTQGAPAPLAWAMDTATIGTFFSNMEAQAPQMKQCIMGCFFCPRELVSSVRDATICGVSCHLLTAQQSVREVVHQLTKSDFGYPVEAQAFAKLYTYPYAWIELSDGEGVTEVRIEDTDGTVDIAVSLNLVFPWLSIDARAVNVGASAQSLTFQNATSHTYGYGGRWAELLWSWGIPVYQVAQDAATTANYRSDYTRAHAQLAATNAKASADASADTAQTNANESATVARSNTNNSAANVTANNAVSVAANTALTTQANSTASELASLSVALASAATSWDNDSCTAAYEADIAGLAVAATNNQISAAAGAVNTVISTVGQLASGNILGAVSTGISGAMNTATSAEMANNSNTVSQSNSTAIYNQTIAANSAKMTNSTGTTTSSTNAQNDQRSANNTTSNNASTSIANNNASLMNTNATNSYNLATGNASRTHTTQIANNQRSYDTAVDAIQANLNQQGVAAQIVFGSASNGEHSATTPKALFASVVTEPDGAIMQAASQFARYGYAYGQQWQLTDWQPCKHFTYWKCSEVWCAGPGNAIESAQQAIKDIMVRGVTVWSDPEEIGMVSVYDNL